MDWREITLFLSPCTFFTQQMLYIVKKQYLCESIIYNIIEIEYES